jgi:glycosyltransferase involved in cell wall biosynthesis
VSTTAKRPIHQFVPALTYGDAISNHTIELKRLLHRLGHPSEIYVLECDPRVASHCRPLSDYRDDPDDVLLYQYGSSTDLTQYLMPRIKRTILYYHNVTPPDFFAAIEPEVATNLARARLELLEMAGGVRSAVTVSEYNRRELEAMGYDNVKVLPLLFDLPALRTSAATRYGQRVVRTYRDGHVNILFVGRLAPNKRQDDLIRALRYYRRLIDRRARLLLVGSAPSFRYQAYLEMLAEHLDTTDGIHFIGQVEMDKGFGAYYEAASVFLCLSEHEGFCVPLIESMYCDLPVIAYASTAVPETMGGAGMLVTEKRYDVIGELIHCVVTDQRLRDQITATQRDRAAAFRRDAVEAEFQVWLTSLDG